MTAAAAVTAEPLAQRFKWFKGRAIHSATPAEAS